MDAKDAGKLMQAHRKRMGLTQDQAAERSTVPTPQYLSALENGRYDVRNSEHFKSLVELYGLTPEQVQEISPSAVFIFETPAPRRPDADPPGFPEPLYEVSDEIYMPEALKEAIDRFGDDPEYAGLRDPDTQREMALARGFRGGPQTAGEWLSYFIDNKRWLTKKDN